MTTENKRSIKRIAKGHVVTAEHLNSMTMGINANTRAIQAPRTRQRNLSGTGQDLGNSGTVDLNFTETVRATSVRTLTDTNGDTVSIDVIDSITFENASGFELVLNFNNPP